MGRGEHSLLLDTHTLSSSPLLCCSFALASMASYALFCVTADSDLSGTLCCISHTQICLLSSVSLETMQSLLHQDLHMCKHLSHKLVLLEIFWKNCTKIEKNEKNKQTWISREVSLSLDFVLCLLMINRREI